MLNQIMDISMFTRPAVIEEIRDQVKRSNDRAFKNGVFGQVRPKSTTPLLKVKTANEWMQQEHAKTGLRELFGPLWHEGELCILFADTNLGKSILAVQIGNNLARGEGFGPLANKTAPRTAVLYIDFEMSAKQFEGRYHDEQSGSYVFEPTFYRAEFNPEADDDFGYDNYEDYLKDALEDTLYDTKARVLIIDNITYMRNGTERARDAMCLMKHLKALKIKHRLSILVLAHTPKRNAAKPITVNDLQGSKMLINFCDSAFAIGESHKMKDGRYLKQIKQRSTVKQYGEDHVLLCHISKQHSFLQYNFNCCDTEQEQLFNYSRTDKAYIRQRAGELKQQGRTYREIADEFGVSAATISRLLN